MDHFRWQWHAVLIACLGFVSGLAALAGENTAAKSAEPATNDKKGIAFFEKRIRPVLVDSCYECHSTRDGNKVKGGLALDSRDGLLRGGESGPALVPGSPDDSLLIEALRHDGLEMPPNKKLPDTVIADFVTWIKMGAPDPRKPTGNEPVARKEIDVEAGRKFWAFQPPRQPALPMVKNKQWSSTEIDQFVLAGLEAKGLVPVGDADPRTWVRRVYFDLTGLPPSPAEVEAFVTEHSSKAKEALVDRLLASPQFGERWARHWLDVARFAESNGNTDNVTFPHAWRYRDYVIAAFNHDKPFDQFIREQLAGDLLPAGSTRRRDEQLIATGFLAIGSKPRAQNNPDFQMDVVAEQIEVATTGFMALTVACARCHDHKFDPIPTREYYSMAGLFTSTDTLYSGGGGQGNGRQQNTGFLELNGDPAAKQVRDQHAAAIAELMDERTKLMGELRRLGAIEKNAKAAKEAKKQAKKPQNPKGKNNPPAADDLAVDVKVPDNVTPEEARRIKKLSEELRQAIDELKDRQANAPPSADLAMGVRDEKSPADCRLCVRGDSTKRGEPVPRGVVSVATIGELPKIESNQSGRLQLAEWIASPANPLTARVAVNRIWQHLFGKGLVATVDNFGELGEAPSHPELLDHLALQFVREGWSSKKMIRTLVLSRTYALASTHVDANRERDPDNIYLWRYAPRRLDSDQFRDAILATSGQLERDAMAGSVVSKSPEQVVQQGKLSPTSFSEAQTSHRSIYLPIVRNAMPEALELFDAPDPSLVVGVRDATTVPAQSLYLMNSPFLIEQSKQFSKRLLSSSEKTDADRIALAFRLALHRKPTASESEQAVSFVKQSTKAFTAVEKDRETIQMRAWAAFCQALFASAEFRCLE
ncbi:MAG: PSD1 and planctomycete cytochrome C domain-containing protein [Planctomycetota bacterium]